MRERVAHLVHPPRDGIAEASFSRSDDALAAASVRVGVKSETPAATRVAIVVARESRFSLPARVALRRGLVASHDARFREADHAVGGHRLERRPLVAVHLRVTLAGVLAGAAIQIRRGVRVKVGVPPVFPLVVRILDAFEGLDLEPVQVHLATLVRGDDDANQLRRRRESERLVRPREKIRVDRVQPLGGRVSFAREKLLERARRSVTLKHRLGVAFAESDGGAVHHAMRRLTTHVRLVSDRRVFIETKHGVVRVNLRAVRRGEKRPAPADHRAPRERDAIEGIFLGKTLAGRRREFSDALHPRVRRGVLVDLDRVRGVHARRQDRAGESAFEPGDDARRVSAERTRRLASAAFPHGGARAAVLRARAAMAALLARRLAGRTRGGSILAKGDGCGVRGGARAAMGGGIRVEVGVDVRVEVGVVGAVRCVDDGGSTGSRQDVSHPIDRGVRASTRGDGWNVVETVVGVSAVRARVDVAFDLVELARGVGEGVDGTLRDVGEGILRVLHLGDVAREAGVLVGVFALTELEVDVVVDPRLGPGADRVGEALVQATRVPRVVVLVPVAVVAEGEVVVDVAVLGRAHACQGRDHEERDDAADQDELLLTDAPQRGVVTQRFRLAPHGGERSTRDSDLARGTAKGALDSDGEATRLEWGRRE